MRSGYIEVQHGKLRVSVPRGVFRDDGGTDPLEERNFRDLMRSRYPWLTERSLDVLMSAAVEEFSRVQDHERRGAPRGRELMSTDPEKAVSYLRRHLESEEDDAEAWYVLGEALCKAGRAQEGYQALARGRSLR